MRSPGRSAGSWGDFETRGALAVTSFEIGMPAETAALVLTVAFAGAVFFVFLRWARVDMMRSIFFRDQAFF